MKTIKERKKEAKEQEKLSKEEEKIMQDLLESDNFKPKPGSHEKGVFDKIRDFFS